MWVDEIDFCVKTYLRPKALERLRNSIFRFYPGAHVTVNSHKCLAAGRNALVKMTRRSFLLMLDDDFEFTEETGIKLLWEEFGMTQGNVGIVAGIVMDWKDGVRGQRHSGGMLSVHYGGAHLTARPETSQWCDVTPNFCLIRRQVFDKCQYRFGIGAEHLDFFMQVRDAGWKVCQLDDVKIDHHPFTPALEGYKAARWDVAENIAAFLNHWKLQRIVVNGRIIHSLPETPCGSL